MHTHGVGMSTTPHTSTPSVYQRINDPVNDGSLVWSTLRQGPVRQIIDEWSHIAYQTSILRQVNSWDFLPHYVDHLDELLILCGFGQPIDDSASDKILWHVVRRATNDELAARIALHRILPALLSIARRRSRLGRIDTHDAINEIIACAWIVIRTFPHERRLNKIAANLVRDSEYHAFVRQWRLKRVQESSTERDQLELLVGVICDELAPHELEDALVEAEALGVRRDHIALLRKIGSGIHYREIARDKGVSERTIRTHQRMAIDEIREALQLSPLTSEATSTDSVLLDEAEGYLLQQKLMKTP